MRDRSDREYSDEVAVGRAASGELTQVTLWQVRAFLEVAECRSITDAAKRLHLTQSSLSRVVCELESTLGAPLFDRKARGMLLTDAGAAFVPYARRMAECYEDAIRGVQGAADPRVIIAGSSLLLPAVVPALLDRTRSDLACSVLVLKELASHEVIQHVASGRADLGICMGVDGVGDEVEAEPLLSAPLGLLIGPGVAMSDMVPDFAALSHLPLARLADDMVLPRALRAHGIAFDAYFHSRVISNSMQALFTTVAQGRVATLVSAIAAANASAHKLRFIPLPHLLPPLKLCLIGRVGSGWQTDYAVWCAALRAVVAATAWPATVERLCSSPAQNAPPGSWARSPYSCI